MCWRRVRLDVLVLVPFQPSTATLLDGPVRRTSVARINLPILEARFALEGALGRELVPQGEAWTGTATRVGAARQAHRSASAIALASALEAAGLRWRAIDPGAVDLASWRKALVEARGDDPHAVALCTTFVMSEPWLRLLCGLVRSILPRAALLIGGYYYASNARGFLSLDADVLCVGEGEERFPRIVRAVRDGESLDSIPGLYLREPGGLRYTGQAEPLDLETLPLPDWRLAARIEPPVDVARDAMVYAVETQRGCVFKCEYCTYRTLAELKMASPARAVGRILEAVPPGAAPASQVDVVDATGTYPRERWEAIVRELAARGGSPRALSVYARVSDISEPIAELMAKAGVRRVFIGQETGDQDLLNRMKKGTKVAQVRPAVHALWRHRIDAVLSFIHGFPGETSSSLDATRRLLAGLNDEEGEPACALYRIEPFAVYDFASVSRDASMKDASHYMGYEGSGELDLDAVLRAVLETVIAINVVDRAPVCESVLDWMRYPTAAIKERLLGREREQTFRELKAMERGVVLFLRARLEGEPVDRGALARVAAALPHGSGRLERARLRLRRSAQRWAARSLRLELEAEARRGPGPLTKSLLLAMLTRDLGSVRAARRALEGLERIEPAPAIRDLATELISGAHRPRKPDLVALRSGRV